MPLLSVLFACLFVSGATSLVYEVVWLRMLGLVFGHTVYALTTVLAVFMAGLGLGSLLFGRRAARFRDPVRTYGLLEIWIGIYAALTPALFWLASSAYAGLSHLLASSYGAFAFAQFLLVSMVLLTPTTLMGGTLPLLSQATVASEKGIARRVGALYAFNTFGAVGGVLLAGYGLVPALGNHSTLWIAAAANLAVGAVAIAFGSKKVSAATRKSQPGTGRGSARAAVLSNPLDPGTWLVVVAFGLSGAVSMIYEVSWTRALTLVLGSSTYAFTAMLAAFLVGIAGGAALYSWLWGRHAASPATFALIQWGIGLAAAMVLLAFDRMPELLLLAINPDSPGLVQLLQFIGSAAALLPSALLIGATLPCAVAACVRSAPRAGEGVGRLYAVNTTGAILGALLAGFTLVPAAGVQAAIKVGIMLNLLLAAGLSLAPPYPLPAWRRCVAGGALAAAAAALFIPRWDQQAMATAPVVYAKSYLAQAKIAGSSAILPPMEVLYYRDGPSATVAVTRTGDAMSLRVNGKADASTGVLDVPTQFMIGHLPFLIHAHPRTALVIGLGSGITAGAIARHPVERLDIVEIEPAVIEASRFFARENGGVLSDPRVRLVIADGRNFLLTTSARYDVIASEPSNPWIGGVASLFSLEFFELARRHLEPGGIMLQWVQGYGLLPGDFQMIVRTFRTVFPATSIWHVSNQDFLLLGKTQPTPIDLNLIKTRYQTNPAVRADLERIGVGDWPGVLGYLMLGEEDAAKYAGEGIRNTDDRLPLEFSAARSMYADTVLAIWMAMRRLKTAELPDVTPESRGEVERAEAQYWIGEVYLARSNLVDALIHFQKAAELEPNYMPALLEASRVSLSLGRAPDALRLLEKALALEPQNEEVRTALSNALAASQAGPGN